MTLKKLMLIAALAAAPVMLAGQEQGGLAPASIRQPLKDSWPIYSGDYTGRRYSALTQVNQQTVKNLSLAWVARVTAGPSTGFGGRGGFGGGGGAPTIVGGEGTGDFGAGATANVKGAILMVDDVLYVTTPDNVWALDARDGREIWHYFWKTKGGTHIGNRGAALWHDYLYVETPDDYLVSLDARTGEERWHVEIADFDQQYFSTTAPMVIDDHVLVGTGNDLDAPGFLQSFDPVTGKLQWKFYTVPMKAGDPGLDTWPNLDVRAPRRWQSLGARFVRPGDPSVHLRNGQPDTGVHGRRPAGRQPVHVHAGRGQRRHGQDGLVPRRRPPHDTHDWDSAQTPVLIDGVIDGQPRKLVSTAARNGYFFMLDRVTGEHLVTTRYGTYTNWAQRIRPNGVVEPDAGKEASIPGVLVSPVEGGVTNWPPPAYSPDTGLFYVQEHNGFNLLYLTDPDPRGSMGLGGKSVAGFGIASATSWPRSTTGAAKSSGATSSRVAGAVGC